MDLHQDHEASGSQAQRARNTVGNLPGRHIGHSQQPADHTSTLIYTLENLGFIVHPEKSMTQPTQRVEFLGMIIDSRSMELQFPGQKIKSIRSDARKSLNERNIPTHRKNDVSRTSDSPCPTVLPDPPERCVLGASKKQSELQYSVLHFSKELRGASMVDRSPDRVEWEESHEGTDPRHDDRIGRMGSNVRWSGHRWPMEYTGKTMAYQLLGDPTWLSELS